MLAIVFLFLGLIPPLIAGPLAGLTFINILKRGKGWYQTPFWALLVAVNLLVMEWVVSSAGVWLSISSFSAWFFTPVASIVTVPVMRTAWHRLEGAGGVDVAGKRWFTLGFVLIPVLQIGMFVALILFGPLLCKAGLVNCRNL
jgi:membrane protein YdbS with pleckstrin-like domain